MMGEIAWWLKTNIVHVLQQWLCISHVLSAFHIEAEACRAGILLALSQDWDAIDLESANSW